MFTPSSFFLCILPTHHTPQSYASSESADPSVSVSLSPPPRSLYRCRLSWYHHHVSTLDPVRISASSQRFIMVRMEMNFTTVLFLHLMYTSKSSIPASLIASSIGGIPIPHQAVSSGAPPWFSAPPGGGTTPRFAPCGRLPPRPPNQITVSPARPQHRISLTPSDPLPLSLGSARGRPTPSVPYRGWWRLVDMRLPPLTC